MAKLDILELFYHFSKLILPVLIIIIIYFKEA